MLKDAKQTIHGVAATEARDAPALVSDDDYDDEVLSDDDRTDERTDDDEEEEDGASHKLITFGPLPNEEPPASALILDYLCNAELTCVPHACTGFVNDDDRQWERIARKIEKKKKRKKAKRNKVPAKPALLVTVRNDQREDTESIDGSSSSSSSVKSKSTRSRSRSNSTGSTSTSGRSSGSPESGKTGSKTGSGTSGGSSSTAQRRRRQERLGLLPPRIPAAKARTPSLLDRGEERDDSAEASQGRGRYSNQTAAATKKKKKKKNRTTPISYLIKVNRYNSTSSDTREGAIDNDNDDADDKEHEGSISSEAGGLSTLGSF